MTYIQAILLGLIQGICEFLPVSSSGHLVLASRMFGLEEGGLLLAVLLHCGTLAAVVGVLWRDIWDMARHPTRPTLWLLALASVPALLAAVALGDALDALFSGSLLGISFLITAALLFSQRFWKRAAPHPNVTARDALVMGAFQAVALLPGVSRSGATLVGGLLSGLDREKAARFCFLMSLPAIVGSLLKEGLDLLGGGALPAMPIGPLIAGVLVSAAAGVGAISLMLWIVRKARLEIFAWYTLALGALVCLDQWVLHIFF